MKKGPMMLAAVEAVTKADPVWASRRHNSHVAASATAGESVHAASPPRSASATARAAQRDEAEEAEAGDDEIADVEAAGRRDQHREGARAEDIAEEHHDGGARGGLGDQVAWCCARDLGELQAVPARHRHAGNAGEQAMRPERPRRRGE